MSTEFKCRVGELLHNLYDLLLALVLIWILWNTLLSDRKHQWTINVSCLLRAIITKSAIQFVRCLRAIFSSPILVYSLWAVFFVSFAHHQVWYTLRTSFLYHLYIIINILFYLCVPQFVSSLLRAICSSPSQNQVTSFNNTGSYWTCWLHHLYIIINILFCVCHSWSAAVFNLRQRNTAFGIPFFIVPSASTTLVAFELVGFQWIIIKKPFFIVGHFNSQHYGTHFYVYPRYVSRAAGALSNWQYVVDGERHTTTSASDAGWPQTSHFPKNKETRVDWASRSLFILFFISWLVIEWCRMMYDGEVKSLWLLFTCLRFFLYTFFRGG